MCFGKDGQCTAQALCVKSQFISCYSMYGQYFHLTADMESELCMNFLWKIRTSHVLIVIKTITSIFIGSECQPNRDYYVHMFI